MVYNFQDYKEYLFSRLDSEDGLGKGGRSRLCEAMGCQTAYLSQVLNGTAHLSMEQAEAVSRFIGHGDDETEYFLLLVQLGRAGTNGLRAFVKKQLDHITKRRRQLSQRLPIGEEITREQQVKYYSSWIFATVHVLTTVPEFRTAETIASRLGITRGEAVIALEFLCRCGLLSNRDGSYEATTSRIHLGDDSDLVSRVHMNWRLRAMGAIERNDQNDLHYSSVVTVARADIPVIREKLMQAIETVKVLVKASPAEEAVGFTLDWFGI